MALFIGGMMCFCPPSYSETLYVFYPTSMRSQIMEKELSEACPEVQLTVFGRYKDFTAKVGTDAPDAVLTKSPVLHQIGGYSVKMRGSRGGAAEEAYVLLSEEKAIDIAHLANVSVGIFDILGRKGTKKFVGEYFEGVPKLKRVSKMEDMLQLLILNLAEAILIPDIYVEYFKGMSKLNFQVTPVPKMKVGIIVLGVKEGVNAPLSVKGLSNMDNKKKALLEVDNWK